MAENKKGFVLYADQIGLFSQLPDDKAGQLIKHIYAYVNDQNPTTDDLVINIAFEPIKQQLKRDLKKFEEAKKQRSQAGKKSSEVKRLYKGNQVYLLKVYNKKETFLKIGITSNSVSKRYSSKETFKSTDYNFEVIYQIFNDNYLEIESKFIAEFSNYKYNPIQNFGGHLECFDYSILDKAIIFLTKFNDVETRSTNSTVIVKDNVNDKVNVNVINKKNIIERKAEFKNSLHPFLEIYSKDLLNDFYSYWTEHGEKDKKMRFEKQTSFSIERRLATWKKNEAKFGTKESESFTDFGNKLLEKYKA